MNLGDRNNLECWVCQTWQAKGLETEELLSSVKSLLDTHAVYKRSDGSYLGMLVKATYAERFVATEASERKTMEIRTKPVKFLQSGHRIVLVATNGTGMLRQTFAILEFQHCMELPLPILSGFYPLHRVTDPELAEYRGKDENPRLYGYQFKLVHIFEERRALDIRTGEVWMYFQLNNLLVKPASPTQGSECPEISAMFMTPFKRKVSETNLLGTASRKRQTVEQGIHVRSSGSSSSLERVPQDQGQMDLDQEGDQDSADNAEDVGSVGDGASDNGEGGEAFDPQSEFVTCIILQQKEWDFINEGQAPGFLRTFKSFAPCLHVLIRPQSGHQCVGRMVIESCQATTLKLAEKTLRDMYTKQQWSDLKSKGKEVYFWTFKELDSFDKPHMVRFLDLAPRFRNRTFKIRRETLASTRVGKHPSKLCLVETASFFFQQLPALEQESIVQTLRLIRDGTIRIGTTCSGTDICVASLQSICKFLNKTEARCIYIHNHVYKYIYIYLNCLYIYILYIYTYIHIKKQSVECLVDVAIDLKPFYSGPITDRIKVI